MKAIGEDEVNEILNRRSRQYLCFNHKYENRNGQLYIFVKTLTGKTITIDVNLDYKIVELKDLIFESEGIRPR